jgi:hypothetical protein
MYGNIVEIYRYKIDYEDIETEYQEDEIKENKVMKTEYCINEEHKNEMLEILKDKSPILTKLDISNTEWIDGLEFDSYDIAKETLEQGEKAYKETNIKNELASLDSEINRAIEDIYIQQGLKMSDRVKNIVERKEKLRKQLKGGK